MVFLYNLWKTDGAWCDIQLTLLHELFRGIKAGGVYFLGGMPEVGNQKTASMSKVVGTIDAVFLCFGFGHDGLWAEIEDLT